MEASKILKTDLLDLLFEDRNKAYGAYDLRKTYNKAFIIAIALRPLSRIRPNAPTPGGVANATIVSSQVPCAAAIRQK